MYRHTVASGDTAVTLSYSSKKTAQAAVLAVYRGIDPTMPVDVFQTGAASSGTTVTAPSVTTTYAGERLAVFQGAAGSFSGKSWTAPSGTTEQAQSNATANASMGLADQTLGAAGATGTRISTFGSSANLTTAMLATPTPTAVLFAHSDQLGSTRLLTDAAGAVRASFTYDSYGKVAAKSGSSSTPFEFAGQYTDAETGFYYLHARYYDPTTAQFLSRDPALVTTRSSYGYVDGNPLNRADPAGLMPDVSNGGGTDDVNWYLEIASEVHWRIGLAREYGDADPGHMQQIQDKINQLRNIEQMAKNNADELPGWASSNTPQLQSEFNQLKQDLEDGGNAGPEGGGDEPGSAGGCLSGYGPGGDAQLAGCYAPGDLGPGDEDPGVLDTPIFDLSYNTVPGCGGDSRLASLWS